MIFGNKPAAEMLLALGKGRESFSHKAGARRCNLRLYQRRGFGRLLQAAKPKRGLIVERLEGRKAASVELEQLRQRGLF